MVKSCCMQYSNFGDRMQQSERSERENSFTIEKIWQEDHIKQLN